ncbi:MAG: 50S ribosomal protein L22 [Christensenellales bacterium]|jgi:large subunit ribosomal protein L22
MATRIREKTKARKEGADTRPYAIARYIRISPFKVRIVLDTIRGRKYAEALAILKSTNKSASEPIIKVLNSAAANAEHNMNLSRNDLFVAEAYADPGPTLKRFQPRAHGRAYSILKRTSHITVILDVVNN